MTKEQIMLFDAKLDKLNSEDLLYFEGFKDCIQFLVNTIFHDAEKDAYKMDDHTMRYPLTRLFYNMKDALEEKLVDELFRRMDQTIEGYKEDFLLKEDPEDDDIPDPPWMSCENDCANCKEDYRNCTYSKHDPDDAFSLPDPGIDFMNIGGNEDD